MFKNKPSKIPYQQEYNMLEMSSSNSIQRETPIDWLLSEKELKVVSKNI